jgi:hypothetical protein
MISEDLAIRIDRFRKVPIRGLANTFSMMMDMCNRLPALSLLQEPTATKITPLTIGFLIWQTSSHQRLVKG